MRCVMFKDLKKMIDAHMAPAIENGIPAGANIAVIYKGETVFEESYGYADAASKKPMTSDAFFRMFSMTKPVTAAAVMQLAERGKIELRYPLKWFISEFEDPMVAEGHVLRPAKRDITIADLLTMTSGIPYPDGSFLSGQKMGEVWWTEGAKFDRGEEMLPTLEFVRKMGKVPLAFDPGEKWMYGSSADVLGAVVEVVSGKRFSEYLKENIFEPLEMYETAFYLTSDRYPRLATCYDYINGRQELYSWHNLCTTDYDKPVQFESGGAGLVSTIGDYEKFVKMLLGGGTYKGEHILGRKTVEYMHTNALSPQAMRTADWDSMKGQGYNCLMRTQTDRIASGMLCSEGTFGWDGWLGCYMSVDPAEELAMLYFIQQTNSGCTDHVRKLQNIIWSRL